MPYSGISDRDLPDHVKKLSKAKRKRWVATFNRVYRDSGGNEGKAMRIANAAVKEGANMSMSGAFITKEAGNSINDQLDRIRSAFHRIFTDAGWIVDFFPDHVVVRQNDQYFRVPYADDQEHITFAMPDEWESVMLDYVPLDVEDEMDVDESGRPDPVKDRLYLSETQLTDFDAGTIEGVVVRVGESANGRFYTEGALKQTGHVFEGVPIFKNHQTQREAREQPERSVDDVIGRIDTVWYDASGALRFKGKISESESAIKTKIKEGILGGMSIVAFGWGAQRENLFHVEGFSGAMSLDLVTFPAAGGEITALHEADREAWIKKLTRAELLELRPDLVESELTETEIRETKANIMTDQSQQDPRLEEVIKQQQQIIRRMRVTEARQLVKEAIQDAGKGLPDMAKKQLVKTAEGLIQAYADDDTQTTEELTETVLETVKEHREYLGKLLPSGRFAPESQPNELESMGEQAFAEAVDNLFSNWPR